MAKNIRKAHFVFDQSEGPFIFAYRILFIRQFTFYCVDFNVYQLVVSSVEVIVVLAIILESIGEFNRQIWASKVVPCFHDHIVRCDKLKCRITIGRSKPRSLVSSRTYSCRIVSICCRKLHVSLLISLFQSEQKCIWDQLGKHLCSSTVHWHTLRIHSLQYYWPPQAEGHDCHTLHGRLGGYSHLCWHCKHKHTELIQLHVHHFNAFSWNKMLRWETYTEQRLLLPFIYHHYRFWFIAFDMIYIISQTVMCMNALANVYDVRWNE